MREEREEESTLKILREKKEKEKKLKILREKKEKEKTLKILREKKEKEKLVGARLTDAASCQKVLFCLLWGTQFVWILLVEQVAEFR